MLNSQFLQKIVLILLCIGILNLSAFAGSVNLSEKSYPLDISPNIDYFQTNNAGLNLENVIHEKFLPYPKKAVHLDFSDTVHWFRITVCSPKSSNWVFECRNPLIEYFDIFVQNNSGGFKIIKGGCFLAKKQRGYTGNHPYANISVKANQAQTFYVKITSQRGFYAKFLMMPDEKYHELSLANERRNSIFDGIHLFGNLLIGIVAFFLFKTGTHKVFAFYSFCISFTVLGYHESLGDFFTEKPIVSALINNFPYRLLVVPEIILTISFIPLEAFPKWVKVYLYSLVILTIVFLCGINLDYRWWWVKVNVWTSVVAESSIIILFIIALLKKVKLNIYFVCAFVFSFLGFLSLQLRLLQIIQFSWINYLILYAEILKIGFFIMMVFQVFRRTQVQNIHEEKSNNLPVVLMQTIPTDKRVEVYESKVLPDSNDKGFEVDKLLIDGAFLQKIDEILEANFSNSAYSIADLADGLNMSTVQLRRKLKLCANQTTVEYIRNFRLKKAGELLKSRSGNVSDVAFMVGFESLSYFTKVFQEFYGKSPSEWLKT